MVKFGFGIWPRKDLVGSEPSKATGDQPLYPTLPCFRSISRDEIQNQPSTSSRLTKLPADIRRKVFVTAFCERTLHVDLTSDAPNPSGPLTQHQKHNERVCKADRPASYPQTNVASNNSWRWESWVCHRNHPDLPQTGMAQRFVR
ncbi:uncharacterized protein VDAG_08071 [Verticillium dahliae VdLs.17]|uniref:Uncharacterized protein n=1 Tax=Verticillium dahliae (strain VdLs.17 / ATCC MYA-4575 / FGSC 10137) TaxID=498257 RepID=G2XD39_VERDV|nr:uncharacterized protein VDAG_08071 [Verticillium dahliae VdLs.17]EGY16907.1 hypothetical protein VDAG_08071 [Verticillium dahliae VdLs.17]KAH6696224.1 hypothetical protein EV126DRAFT_427250 [Verticillium dahliae]